MCLPCGVCNSKTSWRYYSERYRNRPCYVSMCKAEIEEHRRFICDTTRSDKTMSYDRASGKFTFNFLDANLAHPLVARQHMLSFARTKTVCNRRCDMRQDVGFTIQNYNEDNHEETFIRICMDMNLLLREKSYVLFLFGLSVVREITHWFLLTDKPVSFTVRKFKSLLTDAEMVRCIDIVVERITRGSRMGDNFVHDDKKDHFLFTF
jgi:hypothetical protein